MDLTAFAESVGASDPVTVSGAGTRGGPMPDARCVAAPSGIVEFEPAEMTVRCGAGTTVNELLSTLAEAGQSLALPAGGTVGGALACGRSDVYRLGRGPVRDTLLQARYVGARGQVVKAGGQTVKNVSGFDLCRLLVGSFGTLGFLGEVILRTRPRPAVSRWYATTGADPFALLGSLYRPASLLWDGETTWVCLEGHAEDVEAQAGSVSGTREVEGPPSLPVGSRRSVVPTSLRSLTGTFVAEIGVGVVHHAEPTPTGTAVSTEVRSLHEQIKGLFDPTGRLKPGLDVLDVLGTTGGMS